MNTTELLKKIVSMFRPATQNFLGFKAGNCIHGPNDRGTFGFENTFPTEWLVEDFGFTEEEAEQFVRLVHESFEEE